MNTLFGEDPDMRPKLKRPKKGHADVPGTGPDGETCGTCKHDARTSNGGKKVWHKCELMRRFWTSSYGSDIRCKDGACRLWEGID